MFHVENQKTLILGPKTPYFGALRPEFERTIVMFKISTFEFVRMPSIMLAGKNYQSREPKLPDLGIFRLKLEKTIVIFEISTLEFIKNEILTNVLNQCTCCYISFRFISSSNINWQTIFH